MEPEPTKGRVLTPDKTQMNLQDMRMSEKTKNRIIPLRQGT